MKPTQKQLTQLHEIMMQGELHGKEALKTAILQLIVAESTDDLLNRAIVIAARAHDGQFDKARKCYIKHPLRVMQICADKGLSIEHQIVAVLHDVVEDTKVTLEDLKRDFPQIVTDAIDALTKRATETRQDYIARVKQNDIAREVKMADLVHNADLTRLSVFTEKDEKRRSQYLREWSELYYVQRHHLPSKWLKYSSPRRPYP